jgi:hypothetical protein
LQQFSIFSCRLSPCQSTPPHSNERDSLLAM